MSNKAHMFNGSTKVGEDHHFIAFIYGGLLVMLVKHADHDKNKGHEFRTRPLWRNSDYMLLLSGQAISSLGSQISTLAFPLLVLALTHSPALAGVISAARALPYLIFSLPAGALIDRLDRKRIMIICDTGRALSIASIFVALAIGHLTFIQLLLVSMIEGTLFVFFNIAEVACLPQVVEKEQLPSAMAQNLATDRLVILLGTPLSGFLYSISMIFPFLTDTISYIASVGSLFFVKKQFQGIRVTSERKLASEIKEGLIWLWQQPLICSISLISSGMILLSAGFTLITIVLAQRLHASSLVVGVIVGMNGVGGLIGSLLAPLVQKRLRFEYVIVGVVWAVTVIVPFYALAPTPILLSIVVVLFSIIGPIYNVVQSSYRLALIPDALQGRVNSVFRLIVFSSQPLSQVFTGILLQSVGVNYTIFISFAGFFILALMTTFNPHIRQRRPSFGHKKAISQNNS